MVSAKKLLIILFGIFLVFSLFLLCLDLADYKPEEVTLLPISNNQVKTLSTMEVLSMTTYNIGYASLDDKQSFYRHGGLNSRATSENSVLENLNGVVQIIDEINPDFLLFQEVDINSSRSYRVNQLEHINMKYPNYTSFYGKNYDVPWVPIPILKPMGKVESGIATLSRHNISEAYRFSLPGEVKWPNRLFEPDRCFIQARYNIGNGVELIVINIHLSAFNNEGSIRQQQLRYLKSPLSILPNQIIYCSGADLSRPNCSLICCCCSTVALDPIPKYALTGSPGIKSTIKNITIEIIIITGIKCKSLFPIYLAIIPLLYF